MNDKLLNAHLEDVGMFIEDAGIDNESDFAKEFLKQTKSVITQFYEIEKLKDEVAKLSKMVADMSATTTSQY